MATRDELVEALSRRYGTSGRDEKTRIVNEFAAETGFHRKHAMRLLRGGATTRPAAASRPGSIDGRLYFGLPDARDLSNMAIQVKGRKNVCIKDFIRAPWKGAVTQRVRTPPGNCRSSR